MTENESSYGLLLCFANPKSSNFFSTNDTAGFVITISLIDLLNFESVNRHLKRGRNKLTNYLFWLGLARLAQICLNYVIRDTCCLMACITRDQSASVRNFFKLGLTKRKNDRQAHSKYFSQLKNYSKKIGLNRLPFLVGNYLGRIRFLLCLFVLNKCLGPICIMLKRQRIKCYNDIFSQRNELLQAILPVFRCYL